MKTKVSFGLPKGGVYQKSLDLIKNTFGINVDKNVLFVTDCDYNIVFLKHRDIAHLVNENKLDFGITSQEWLYEVSADVRIVKELNWCDTKVALIVEDVNKQIKSCITEFPNIAKKYFNQRGMKNVIVDKISGSSEALVPMMYDSCIDCIETGKTISVNNLHIKEVIHNSRMVLICNKSIDEKLINRCCRDICLG